MKALFLIDHLGGGGAPLSVLGLAQALAARGAQVTILVLSDKIWHEMPPEVKVVQLPFAYRNVLQKWQRYRLHARRVDAWLASQPEAFDLVVANLHYAHEVTLRSQLAMKAWYCIRTDPAEALLNKTGFARFKQARRLTKLYRNRRVIALAQGSLDSLDANGATPARGEVIPNVIDIEAIHARMSGEVEFDDYVVYVGRLNRRQKRYDRLFRAYQASGLSQQLLVIGDGELEQAKSLAEEMGLGERVVFLGKLDNPYPYIRNARFLVLTSDYEGFGRVLPEALACGTPVLSTDCPSGPRDILTGELASYLVPRDDEQALAIKMAALISSPPTIRPEPYMQYSPERIAQRYEALE